MRILIFLTLALGTLPAIAQPDVGAEMFPIQTDGRTPRPAEVNLQIKQDLQQFAQTFNSTLNAPQGDVYVYDARPGFFGASAWMRDFSALLNGNSVQVDDVKLLERDGDTAKAAVVYSFKLSPYAGDVQREFWKGARQEILTFKLRPAPYDLKQMVWQIVPPDAPPPAIRAGADGGDVLWRNVAYYLAQKQVPALAETPAQRSLNNLKLLGLGVAQLVQDYDEVYAFDPRFLIEAVTPYTRDSTVFQVPEANEIYTFNANLSGLKQAAIDEVYQTVLFYEGCNQQPIFRYDGRAAIGFADGHVALVSPDEAKGLIWKP